MPKDGLIADWGCGTGILGTHMKEAGFTNIEGLDGSEGMLEVCKGLNIYKKLDKCLIGLEPLPAGSNNKFDGIVSSACFIPLHFTNVVFDLAHESLKVGGLMSFAARNTYLELDNELQYMPKIQELIKAGKFEEVERIDFVKYKGIK